MNRDEVMTGIAALRYKLEKDGTEDLDYYDEVLTEARNAVLLNEQQDPHSKANTFWRFKK
tara:strand:- start:892 stop:1071 length:180 start_codon:yes stop_codon:yes gene_type:complete